MEIKFHSGLTLERWSRFSRAQKLLNIASELSRAKSMLNEKNYDYMKASLERVLELIDMSTATHFCERAESYREWLRLREELSAFYVANDFEGQSRCTSKRFTQLTHLFLQQDPKVCNMNLKV